MINATMTPEGTERLIMDIFKPKHLNYYRALLGNNANHARVNVVLTMDQAAAVLKAHDHGIAKMDAETIALLDQVASILKEEIWP